MKKENSNRYTVPTLKIFVIMQVLCAMGWAILLSLEEGWKNPNWAGILIAHVVVFMLSVLICLVTLAVAWMNAFEDYED